MDQATLQHCFEGQRAAFRSKMPGYVERLEALCSLESALLKHKGQIVAAISDDFGGRAAEETLAWKCFLRWLRSGMRSRI